jgi:sugar diacid utilization regulator
MEDRALKESSHVNNEAGPASPGAQNVGGFDDVGSQTVSDRQYEEAQWRAIEEHLSGVVTSEGGISGLVAAASNLTPNPLWLIDTRGRVVARSTAARGSDFHKPDLTLLLGECGPINMTSIEPVLVTAQPAIGLARRHALVAVVRGRRLYAWLVMAEVSSRVNKGSTALLCRTAFHLAGEYSLQRRVAMASWNARSTLARQLIRGSYADDDVVAAAEYLGVRVESDRVIVYVADPTDQPAPTERELCDALTSELGVEVLSTRGREGTVLLVEVEDGAVPVAFVLRMKALMRRTMIELGNRATVVGVSAVSSTGSLERAYRETREVIQCVDRFSPPGGRVIAVDDLGPARLFVANGDVRAVRRYARDTLGVLLTPTSPADLLRTLFCFFDADRGVRETAHRLGIHENTVRLRLAKIHDITGLDVAADAQDQLSAQTALLLLRLEGHPDLPDLGGQDPSGPETGQGS